MAILLTTILAILPGIALLIPTGLSTARSEGTLLMRIHLPLYARLKLLAPAIALAIAASIVAILTGPMRLWHVVIVVAIHIGTLFIPLTYTLTTSGIKPGLGSFRRWTEFAGVRRSTAGALCQGVDGKPGLQVVLTGGPIDDDIVLSLRNLIRDGYKGKSISDGDVPLIDKN